MRLANFRCHCDGHSDSEHLRLTRLGRGFDEISFTNSADFCEGRGRTRTHFTHTMYKKLQ